MARTVVLLVCLLLAACAKAPLPTPAAPPSPATGALHPTLQLQLKTQVDTEACPNAVRRCGEYVRLTCRPEVDGLDAYYDNRTGNLVMACGGACMKVDSPDPVHCKQCPPKEWTCGSGG